MHIYIYIVIHQLYSFREYVYLFSGTLYNAESEWTLSTSNIGECHKYDIFAMILIMKNSMKKEENKILVNVRKDENGSYWKGTEEMLIFYVTFQPVTTWMCVSVFVYFWVYVLSFSETFIYPYCMSVTVLFGVWGDGPVDKSTFCTSMEIWIWNPRIHV